MQQKAHPLMSKLLPTGLIFATGLFATYFILGSSTPPADDRADERNLANYVGAVHVLVNGEVVEENFALSEGDDMSVQVLVDYRDDLTKEIERRRLEKLGRDTSSVLRTAPVSLYVGVFDLSEGKAGLNKPLTPPVAAQVDSAEKIAAIPLAEGCWRFSKAFPKHVATYTPGKYRLTVVASIRSMYIDRNPEQPPILERLWESDFTVTPAIADE